MADVSSISSLPVNPRPLVSSAQEPKSELKSDSQGAGVEPLRQSSDVPVTEKVTASPQAELSGNDPGQGELGRLVDTLA